MDSARLAATRLSGVHAAHVQSRWPPHLAGRGAACWALAYIRFGAAG